MAEKDAQKKTDQKLPGEILREAREAQGIAIEEVHEVTKIPMDAIRAIEENYTIRTLSPFYRKSFTKIYAKFLEMDPTEVLREEAYKSKPSLPKEEKDMMVFGTRPTLADLLTPRRLRQLFLICALLFVFFLLFKVLTFLIHKTAEYSKARAQKHERVLATEKAAAMAKKKASASKTKAVAPVAPVKPAVPAAPSFETPPPTTKPVSVTVRASRKTWLRVKSDGDTLFQSVLKKGDVETWVADKQVEISGGIDKLEFEINGKLIGKLGRQDRRAKTIRITKDGLTVQKND